MPYEPDMSSSSPSSDSGDDKPRRMLMIGYNTVDEAVAKGILRTDDQKSLELYYNFDQMFDEVLYVVPFGRKNIDQRLTSTIAHRELALPRTHRGIRFAMAGLAHIPRAKAFVDAAVRDFKPDVVQICGPHIPAVIGLMSREVRQLPSVCFIEAFWETIIAQQVNLPCLLRAVLPIWYRRIYRIYDQYTGAPSVSPEYFVERGMKRSRIARWVQAVDLRQLIDACATEAPVSVLSAPHPRIVVVGRLHPEKLAGDALEIFARAVQPGHNGTLVFVGDGIEREAIEERARELGLADRVVITGLLPLSSVLAALKASDYSIAPMQGSALLETLGSGLPVVAYDHETHRALIDSGRTGVLVPHRDVAAAAVVLERWLADGEIARPMGAAARDWVFECFSPAKMREIYFSAFLEAMKVWNEKRSRGTRRAANLASS